MPITEKRAKLYREWLLATMANDERYYLMTLSLGIPDGMCREDVFDEIKDGKYDDCLNEILGVYEEARVRYGANGYIIDGALSFPGDEQYKRLMYILPGRIYKTKR